MSDVIQIEPVSRPVEQAELLTLDGVAVERHGKQLLHPTRLTLGCGEKLAILGPNGAGKSTLLKCLAGDIRDYAGHIHFDQQPLTALNGNHRARRIAVMPQHAEMMFPFRVSEVVALGRTPFTDEIVTRHWQERAMQLTECWHLRDRRYPSLSGGEQQRVQLARVLVQIWQALENATDNHLLLLDECTSALDPAHQHSIMDAVNRFATSGVGVIAVMHDVALAASWADTVVLLKNGAVMYHGDSRGLTDAQLLADCYDLPIELAKRHAASNALWM
ncbi:heme ABC transporter ATP-binding protein [Oceanobacter kriegii]|uniref:heme ABC transporter ATP-binding protein n=1 Tax=Oceanobacter kriegii TaxID=64972 RepID=UPI0004243C30|nr:heme ABC transporter ATP-binding protein [Oceanobacter kriegii]